MHLEYLLQLGHVLLYGVPPPAEVEPVVPVESEPTVSAAEDPILEPEMTAGLYPTEQLTDPADPAAITQLIGSLQHQAQRLPELADIEVEEALYHPSGLGIARSRTRVTSRLYYVRHPVTGSWSVFDIPFDAFDPEAAFTKTDATFTIATKDGCIHHTRDGVTWFQLPATASTSVECRLSTPEEVRYALYRFTTGGFVQAKQFTRTGELCATHFQQHDPAGRPCSYYERVVYRSAKTPRKKKKRVRRPHLTAVHQAGYVGGVREPFP